MNKYQTFIFKAYDFNKEGKTLKLVYSYDNEIEFSETYRFDFEFIDYDESSLNQAINLLFLTAGISYYKAFLAPEIKLEAGNVDQALSEFLSRTYQNGLGEFFYVNKLDPRTRIVFPINSDGLNATNAITSPAKMIGIGGGKDSLVSVEMLRDSSNVSTFSVDHKQLLSPLVQTIGLPHLWIERQFDPKIKELNAQGAYNGHVPISAIIGCVGVVCSVLSGNQDIIVSNESSASEPTLVYNGVEINHQYSKSLAFEKDFQTVLGKLFNDSVRYYSLLRPLSELRIAELFAKVGFAKYRGVFSSCNRAFASHGDHMYWCGECPKCAFVFMALTPFINREELESIWGKNLLLDPSLKSTYEQLLGIAGDKPLDCVGEIKESRTAMRLAQQIYPELNSYKFFIPEGYDYKAMSSHSMPEDEFDKLKDFISKTLSE